MRLFNSKSLAIFLFCCVRVAYGSSGSAIGAKPNNQVSAGLFSSVNNTNSSRDAGDTTSVSSDSITVDTKNDSLVADGGAKFQYQGLKLQAFGFNKNPDTNVVEANGDVRVQVGEGNNKMRLDSEKTLLSLNNGTMKYYNSFSYIDVGDITGAIDPNRRIYFGGEVGEYNSESYTLKEAWFTTDFHILDSGDYKQGGYYLKSQKLEIVTDNKAVFKNTNLYIHNHKVGWMPWYAINIRKGSQVPLFPVWGSDSEYGFNISQGINYGNTKSKYFKGGIAPKYSDKLGLLVGRYENWHDLGKYGKGMVSVDNLLVAKKYGDLDNRWNFNASHEYKNNNGYLNLGFQSTTVNEIDELQSYRDDLEQDGYFDPTSKNYKGSPRNDGKSIDFVTVDSEFTGLGDRNDTDFHAKAKLLTNGEDLYRQLVDDRMDDAAFDAELDNKLFADVGFKKDNSDYMISGYYDFLKDLDPGSTSDPEDDQSRRENFGGELLLKDAKIDLAYDHKSGDKLRQLRSWERNPDLKSITRLQGGEINYVPFAVSKYDTDDSDTFRLHLGEYKLFNTAATYKVKFDSKSQEQKLSLADDPFRKAAATTTNTAFNKRDQQYNKNENIIYNKNREDKTGVEFAYDQYRLELTFGKSSEEIWDREGIYNYSNDVENDAYNKYSNESNFVQAEVEDQDLNLGYAGDLELKYNLRYDDYTKGYDSKLGDNDGGDSSLRHQININHKLTLLDNTNNHFRLFDFKLTNEFNFFTQQYSYDDGDRSGNSEYNGRVRLKNKDGINEFKDKVNLDLGNTTTIYSFGYKQTNDAYDKKKKNGELYTHNIDFLVDDEKKLNLYYDLDKRYTRGELTTSGYEYDKDHNDLTNHKFGGSYFFTDSFRFYYTHEKVDTDLLESNLASTDPHYHANAQETAIENTYGFEIKDDLDIYNFDYTRGTDNRKDDNLDTLKVKNDIITASYLNGGDVEHFYSASYGIYKYGPTDSLKQYSVDQVSFKYEYRDKRFTDEELRSYAAAEFNKKSLDTTAEEISKVREILNKRNDNQLDFHLHSIMFEEMNEPEYKKFFKLATMAKISKEAYLNTHDLYKSSKELQASIYGSYKRYGIGYNYDETANVDFKDNYERKVTKQEHEIRIKAGIGKPSEGWNIKLNYKTKINYDGTETKHNDEYGIYLGKEMGYYEWSVGFLKNYDRNTREYDSRVALQFTLLTFPDKPLFGIGYKDETKHMSPKVWLGDGVKVEGPDSM